MPSFNTHRTVNHSAGDMFALVADVERYPEFVPLCDNLSIDHKDVAEDGTVTIEADMTVAYKFFRETFKSRVHLKSADNVIEVDYLDGPFKKMENIWRFEPRGESRCVVHFSIDYAFKSRSLGLLMGAMFDKAFRKFSKAFEERADTLYNKTEIRGG
jgi:coenzyme Q-binding protein COQ10